MGDEVREVPRGVPFSEPRRPTSVGARERLLEEQERRQQQKKKGAGEGEGRAEESTDAFAGGGADKGAGEAGFGDLERAVAEANARLEQAGRGVRLALARADGRPVVDILVPDPQGVLLVRRRIEPDEIVVWVARIESNEGLLLDEKL